MYFRSRLAACCVVWMLLPGSAQAEQPYLVILGVAQDGGFPQAGCQKECCRDVWKDPSKRKFVSSLAIVDPDSGQRWLIDATPDFRDQLRMLDDSAPRVAGAPVLSGIFLTHAHVGHYSGLMHLGREVMGANQVPVYAMPRMREFLRANGPWEQLVKLKQIELKRLAAATPVRLNSRIEVTPFLVPHRDEYSETVGYEITCGEEAAVFVPDIDKWERWDVPIECIIARSDLALLDGTFFDASELPGRSMDEIPHPFIAESLSRLAGLPKEERQKVRFIHLNHSNPALRRDSAAAKKVFSSDMQLAEQGSVWSFGGG